MKQAGLAGVAILVAGVVLLFGLQAHPVHRASAAPAPAVGHPAPNFALPSVGGRSVSLRSLRGHVVLLNFFATWCVPCRKELPEISRAARANPRSVDVLAVDEQEPAGVIRAFRSQERLPFQPLIDANGTVAGRYHVIAQPVSFWVDRNGTVAAVHYGAMSAPYIEREIRTLG